MSRASADSDIIQLEVGWTQVKTKGIEPFINLIENKERSFFKAKEFVDLYDVIFKMCIQRDPYNHSEAMYERYSKSIADYLNVIAKQKLDEPSLVNAVAYLKEWNQRWANHKLIVLGFSKLFMYLDRFHTTNHDGILPLKEQGYKLYKEIIFDNYSAKARDYILQLIAKEREKEQQDRELLSNAVTVFVEMGQHYGQKKAKLYKSDLEKPIIEEASKFYARQSLTWLEQDSTPTYLKKAEDALREERTRVDEYLHSSTMEPLQLEVYNRLLRDHQKALLEKKTGLDHMLSTNSKEDLSRLYRLYKDHEGDRDLIPIAEQFQEHVARAGGEIVDKAKPSEQGEEKKESGAVQDSSHTLVRDLIALHATYNDIVQTCFEKSQLFQKSLKKAFEEFINRDTRVSKLLAKYVNDILKKGSKLSVKDLENTLDNVVFLYGYISEKDIFERDYQLFLAHRLLHGLCESEHSEKSMIAKLKTECGYQWTNKLEGMFKDIQLSKDLMLDFKQRLSSASSLGPAEDEVDLEVNVCTTGYWPTSKAVQANMPQELAPVCDQFKKFYLSKQSGHKLEWRFDQGQAEILVDFTPTYRRALVVTTYQMMIMLVFNNYKRVTLKQILDITGVPRSELGNHLLSLCHPKVGVLLKRPNTKKLEENHQFMINPQYQNQLKKVNIPFLKGLDVVDTATTETDEENKTIELQRRHQMDAAIVRIMKTRKTLRHAVLVGEVMQQLNARFKPKPNDIKKRIEALIEQEYLERDATDRSIYNYLA